MPAPTISVLQGARLLIEVHSGPPPARRQPRGGYERRIEVVSEFVIYRGEAAPGSLDDDPVWRVRRIDITYGSPATSVSSWAGNSPEFTRRWSARETYTYP